MGRELHTDLHHEREASVAVLRVLSGAGARGREHGRYGVSRAEV